MSLIRKEPILRFPEFSGVWYEKAFSEITEINPKSKDLPESFVYIDLESVDSGKLLFEKRIFKDGSPSRAQRNLLRNDILFQMVRPYQKNNFFFNRDGDYVASTGYAQLRSNQVPKFLYQLIHTEKFVNRVLVRCTGSNYPAINSNDLKSISVLVPPTTEQKKISDFLTSVDRRIELLEKKKSLLEAYKKGVMKKIFSKEIRFKDDGGNNFPNWEEKSLGEISKITIGEFVIRTKQNPNGQYPVFNGGKSFTGFYDEFNNEGNKIIISARGANAGFVNFEKRRYWAGNSCYSIDILDKKNNDVIFFYYLVKFFENRFTDFQQAANIPSVSKKDVSIFQVFCPLIQEQNKISSFLLSIDNQIELLDSQIEKSKIWKKGLLQKMFV